MSAKKNKILIYIEYNEVFATKDSSDKLSKNYWKKVKSTD